MKLSELKRLVDELLATPEFDGRTEIDILMVRYDENGNIEELNYSDFQYFGVAGDRVVACNVDSDDLSEALEATSDEDPDDLDEEEETVGDLPFGTRADEDDEDINPRQQEL